MVMRVRWTATWRFCDVNWKSCDSTLVDRKRDPSLKWSGSTEHQYTSTTCCFYIFYMQINSYLFILCKRNPKKEHLKTTGNLPKLRDSVRAFVAKDGSSNDSTLNREMQQSPSIPYVRSWKSQSLFQNCVLSWMTVVIGCFWIPQDEICHYKKTPRHSKTINTTIFLYIFQNEPYNISVLKIVWMVCRFQTSRKVFDETLQQTAQQSFTLEHRLSRTSAGENLIDVVRSSEWA